VRQEIPTIACGIPLGFESTVGHVAADDLGGGRRMTRHLLDTGRTRIATITGPLDTPGGRLRLEGYRAELGDAYDESLVAHGDYTRQGGTAAMRELLERRPDLDAVFVGSDLMATGAMQVLRESGRSVPGDVAVGGFDDSGLAATLDPALTTMRQPFERISAEMVRLLLDVVEGADPATITLPTSLVVRAST
jgi:DNA-binding LacI/PurR family transcriptional regulator